MKIQNFILGLLILSLLAITSVSALSSDCNLQVNLINQDPVQAIPGSYVNIVFQVSGVQNTNCEGMKFEVLPSYPFSIDGNTLRTLDGSTWTANSNTWNIPYSVRVDKDALDGDTPISVKYNSGNSNLSENSVYQTFNITVKDSRTNFDAVIQQVSGSDVSIAIANTGKYTANSMIVKIPEQDNFKTIDTDGQMVGNLASGDYSVVSFSLAPQRSPGNGMASGNNMNNSFRQNQKADLKFDIYYTDSLGERRVVNMELPVSLKSNFTAVAGGNTNYGGGFRQRNSASSFSGWYLFAIGLVVVIILFLIYHKYHRQIKNKLFKHKKNSDTSQDLPDWIRNVKDKEKRK